MVSIVAKDVQQFDVLHCSLWNQFYHSNLRRKEEFVISEEFHSIEIGILQEMNSREFDISN